MISFRLVLAIPMLHSQDKHSKKPMRSREVAGAMVKGQMGSDLASWVTQNSGITSSLRDVYFIDEFSGWAVGDSGVVLATTDGGKVWTKDNKLPGNPSLEQIQFVDANTGFVAGDLYTKITTYSIAQAQVFKTTDRGIHWERCNVTSDTNLSFNGLQFLNPKVGYIGLNNIGPTSYAARKGVLLKTTDGGATWSTLREKSLLLLMTSVFASEAEGYSFWSPSIDNFDNTDVDITRDSGKTWTGIGTIEAELVSKSFYKSPNNFWAIGFKTSLSRDSGRSWQSWNWFNPIIGGQKRIVPKDIEMTQPSNIWLLCNAFSSGVDGEGDLLKSSDFGNNWTVALKESSSTFIALSIINNSKAWIVGTNGLIKYCENISMDVVKKIDNVPTNVELFQNYPNPFNGTTVIKCHLPTQSSVALEIYDLLGRNVATLVNGDFDAGEHDVAFDASSFNSGLYFYRLTANGFVSTRKMIVLK